MILTFSIYFLALTIIEIFSANSPPLTLTNETLFFKTRFVFVYIAISVIIALVDKLGFTPVYMIAFVSGLVDVDAITISLAQFALTGHISYAAATNGIILATIANTITKWFLIHWIGNKRMMFQVGRVYITLIALSALLMSL